MERSSSRVLAFSRARILYVIAFAFFGIVTSAAIARASTIEETAFPSAALGHELPVAIYKPDGRAPSAGWPVLYLLHGLHGGFRDWATLGGIQSTLDRLIAEHAIRPLVVAMPDAGNSWYVDSASVGGPGNFETAILEDLPLWIETALPVRHDRGGRAIAGLSMGGFGALRLALKRPDRYGAVASLSGAIWQNMPLSGSTDAVGREGDAPDFQRLDSATIVAGIDHPPGHGHFGAAFGAPFDAHRFNDANVFTLLAQQLRAGAKLPAIYLTVGDHDSHGLWRGSICLFETLMADGVNANFRVTGGDHDWSLWRKSIVDALLFIDSKFLDSVAVANFADHSGSKFAGAAASLK
jgi:S-formylglutathione hydrolase FrmB